MGLLGRKLCIVTLLGLLPFYSFAEDLIEIEHLWLTQNVHVSAEYLCQDGQYIYFKSKEDCAKATTLMACTSSLKVTPISFMEKVELPSGDSVSRFYSVKTSYDYLRYELSSDSPIKNYDLVESRQIPLPVCKGMGKKKTKKIKNIRIATPHEIPFMQGLVDSGVSIVNSPYGIIDSKTIKTFEMNTPNPRRPQLKSPLCSSKLNYDDLVHQASGEWTGNGIVHVESLNTWQKESMDLYIQKTKGVDSKVKYEFFCLNEAEDVQ